MSAQTTAGVSEVKVEPGRRFQVIEGFGVNYTGPYFRDDQKRMFDLLIDDLGASMFRVVAYFVGTDWEVANDNAEPLSANWNYFDERYSNPVFEASWKGLRYLNSRGIRPVLALMGPAPAWMVEDSSAAPKHKVCSPNSRQGRLKPEMYDEFAETVVTMAAYARRKAGIEFDYFSPVNETDCYPGEGPRIDPEEMPKVLAAIARRMNAEGLGEVKLVAAENAIIGNDYLSPVMANKDLMKQVGAFALHSYSDGSVGPHVESVNRNGYARVPVWLTEYGSLADEDRTSENEWKEFALASNRRALIALNQGAAALFYFNAFDDYEECMKRHTYYGLFTSASHVYSPRKRYYATRQLYHFVAPGSRRIEAVTEAHGLTVSAFTDGDKGAITVVGVKEGGARRIRVSLPALAGTPDRWELYLTTKNLDCRKTGTFRASGGMVEFELPDEAVFTLVGKTLEDH
ncbi:MAG: hypothetical protein ABI693_13780 [Bryobacteraceae bacterium]